MGPMVDQRGRGVACWLARRAGVGLVLLLCLCVFLQMLGVPAPLLNAGGSFEMDDSSVLEGWSIQPLCPLISTSSDFVLVDDTQPFMCVPILARAFFRPPLS
jgi:hypothetical protein